LFTDRKLDFVLLPAILLMIPTVAYASNEDPYDSGYDHGCDDAGLDAGDRYINEEGKGPSHHTERFMDGYNAGFSSCGGGGGGSGSGESDSERLCRLLDNNRAAATAIAFMLGYPGLDQAALALCGVVLN
jgi:hypothetical protein